MRASGWINGGPQNAIECLLVCYIFCFPEEGKASARCGTAVVKIPIIQGLLLPERLEDWRRVPQPERVIVCNDARLSGLEPACAEGTWA